MADSASALYQSAVEALQEALDRAAGGNLPELSDQAAMDAIDAALAATDIGPRAACLTQLLVKSVLPEADAHDTRSFPNAPAGFSSRSLAKNVVASFDAKHLQRALGSRSDDPYVTQSLRRARLDASMLSEVADPAWNQLVALLDFVQAHPLEAGAALVRAVSGLWAMRLDLSRLIADSCQVQARWLADPNSAVARARRRELVELRGPSLLDSIVGEQLSAEGSAGKGDPAEVPWMRVFSPRLSPSATAGTYLAYLITAVGDAAYLSIQVGTDSSGAGEVDERVQRTRAHVTGSYPPSALETVDLKSAQPSRGRPHAYERANIIALRYDAAAVPNEDRVRGDLQEMLALLETIYAVTGDDGSGTALEETTDDPRPVIRPRGVDSLTLKAVQDKLEEQRMSIEDEIVLNCLAALSAGKDLMLIGPPGTGKTTLAQALAAAALDAGLNRGAVMTTATADWTSLDTVGGYWVNREGKLYFRPGQALAAIRDDEWLVIDELNRADIDKAFGQLFTVLSGHPVTLPFMESHRGGSDGHADVPVAIYPFGKPVPAGTSAYHLSKEWRLIATLNTRDRDLLFNMSYALLRRFAAIEVPVPTASKYKAILAAEAPTGSEDLDARLQALIDLPHRGRSLGPAILIDCGRHLQRRLAQTAEVNPNLAVAEAIQGYVMPQLDDLSARELQDVIRYLGSRVFTGWSESVVRRALSLNQQTVDLQDDSAAEDSDTE